MSPKRRADLSGGFIDAMACRTAAVKQFPAFLGGAKGFGAQLMTSEGSCLSDPGTAERRRCAGGRAGSEAKMAQNGHFYTMGDLAGLAGKKVEETQTNELHHRKVRPLIDKYSTSPF